VALERGDAEVRVRLQARGAVSRRLRKKMQNTQKALQEFDPQFDSFIDWRLYKPSSEA
jgi:hypothetical protein